MKFMMKNFVSSASADNKSKRNNRQVFTGSYESSLSLSLSPSLSLSLSLIISVHAFDVRFFVVNVTDFVHQPRVNLNVDQSSNYA